MKARTTIGHDTGARHVHKYQNKNPIHRLVLGRFLDAVAEEIKTLGKGRVLDFGCGEALFWQQMALRGAVVDELLGIDLREDALKVARERLPHYAFEKRDLLEWHPDCQFELVVASEVLEHLPGPEEYLRRLVSLASAHLLLTVPWEPFFRLSNLARGRDIKRLGNHPEHVNLWSARQFDRFVSGHAKIVRSTRVFPFLIVVAQPR